MYVSYSENVHQLTSSLNARRPWTHEHEISSICTVLLHHTVCHCVHVVTNPHHAFWVLCMHCHPNKTEWQLQQTTCVSRMCKQHAAPYYQLISPLGPVQNPGLVVLSILLQPFRAARVTPTQIQYNLQGCASARICTAPSLGHLDLQECRSAIVGL